MRRLRTVTIAGLVALGAVSCGQTTSPTGGDEDMSLVSLGDSVPAASDCPRCEPFVVLLADRLSADVGETVRGFDLGVPGATSTDMLNSLNSDDAVVSRVGAAKFVTITIGANDVADLTDVLAAGGCPDAACLDERTLSGVRERLDAVLNRVAEIRGGRRDGVFVTGYWNDFPDGQTALREWGPQFVRDAAAVTAKVNTAIAASAQAADAVYVDLTPAFKGPDGAADPTDLLSEDGDHPSQAGHRAIADQLEAAASAHPVA